MYWLATYFKNNRVYLYFPSLSPRINAVSCKIHSGRHNALSSSSSLVHDFADCRKTFMLLFGSSALCCEYIHMEETAISSSLVSIVFNWITSEMMTITFSVFLLTFGNMPVIWTNEVICFMKFLPCHILILYYYKWLPKFLMLILLITHKLHKNIVAAYVAWFLICTHNIRHGDV